MFKDHFGVYEMLSCLLFYFIFTITLVGKHSTILILVKDQFPILMEDLKTHSFF